MPNKARINRRTFIGAAASAAVVAAVSEMGATAGFAAGSQPSVSPIGNQTQPNSEEKLYSSHCGSFTKGLPHDDLGVVSAPAYDLLLRTLATGPDADFEALALSGRMRLANPQAAYAFVREGYDPASFPIPAPPPFASAAVAAEMVELYWQALLRDVPFAEYASNPLAQICATELTSLSAFGGVKAESRMSPAILFRGTTPGETRGPYISQFLVRDIPYGATKIAQRYKVPVPGDDHLTQYDAWLNCQRGYFSKEASPFDPQLRYIRNGRELGEYVRRDFSFQAFLNATLILLGEAYPRKSFRAPFSSNHPYLESETQNGFTTFGAPYVLDLVTRVSNLSLKACWREKWLVHRRVRPEEFGGHLQNHFAKNAAFPFHRELLEASVLGRIKEKQGTWLLPQAYPDGCPTHPAYPSGHAATAGACVTVLKALFDQNYVFAEPVFPSADGLALVPYEGQPLTVAGELNKLAANIAMGRNFAGIHWRSDMTSGLRLGEMIALKILQEQRAISPEHSGKFKLQLFDGTNVEV